MTQLKTLTCENYGTEVLYLKNKLNIRVEVEQKQLS